MCSDEALLQGFAAFADRIRDGRCLGDRTGDRDHAVTGGGEGHALRYRGRGAEKKRSRTFDLDEVVRV